MPRAAPRAVFRPQAGPSTYIARPSLAVFGQSKRGFASEAGVYTLISPCCAVGRIPALPGGKEVADRAG